jgi:hypothetical protein
MCRYLRCRPNHLYPARIQAGHCGRVYLRHRNFNLAKQRYDLLRADLRAFAVELGLRHGLRALERGVLGG